MSDPEPLRLCLFGAAGDTGNLGVSALLHATLGALARQAPDARVTVFDNGWGEREAVLEGGSGRFAVTLCGARLSRRLHRPESFWNMRLAARLGGLWNPGARALLDADAVWDLSGGDSFSDLYGRRVLAATLAPKELALARRVPLVLLPQTYGPFRTPGARARARAVLGGARLAWARDARSHAALAELLGARFEPDRHRAGVDVAFLLEPRAPERAELEVWLAEGGPIVGLNVSGLVHGDPRARQRFGLRADYRAAVLALARRLLAESEARLLLVPHVHAPETALESDARACRALAAELGAAGRGRVRVLSEELDERETKWVLGRLEWFCGTRMHACIGALSSGTPAASLAYSLKTKGVFETCGLGDAVAELEHRETRDAVALVWRAWSERAAARARLAERLPDVVRRAEQQLALTLERSRAPERAS